MVKARLTHHWALGKHTLLGEEGMGQAATPAKLSLRQPQRAESRDPEQQASTGMRSGWYHSPPRPGCQGERPNVPGGGGAAGERQSSPQPPQVTLVWWEEHRGPRLGRGDVGRSHVLPFRLYIPHPISGCTSHPCTGGPSPTGFTSG